MVTVMRLRFPAGRYHATPWGAHVNEGQVEWPPSPWRLLRALLCTGFTKLGWPADEPPPLARRLIERLAPLAPSYVLPRVALAHTRHFVDAAGKRPLIFDAWAQVDEGEIEVVWPVELAPDERVELEALASMLGYLGRAESLVEASVASAPRGAINCHADADAAGPPGPRWQAHRVTAAMAPTAYADWRRARVAPIVEAHAVAPGKKLSAAGRKKLDRALDPYPADLVAALCAETGALQRHGWSVAPGSREVSYWRRADALSVTSTRRSSQARGEDMSRFPFALLALSTPSRGTSALPPLHRAFAQGRLLHRAIGSVVGRYFDGAAPLALCLLGRENGGPSTRNHGHAHLLHLDLGGHSRLDHALVWAPMGLDATAEDALRHLRRTYMKGGAGELHLAISAVGEAAELRRLTAPLGDALDRVLGPVGGAFRWQSATPFVAARLFKRRGKDSLEGQIRLECHRRDLPEPVEIEVAPRDGEDVSAFRHYVIGDDNRHRPPRPVRFALRLHFDEPVEGPLCLGYGAHAGLGRFEALR